MTPLQRRILERLAEGPVHGYALAQELGTRSVFTTVQSLRVQGLVEAQVDYDNPHLRRVLSLTDKGRKALDG